MTAFRLAYDGRPYNGFQRQPDVPTVEDRLFAACRALDVCADEPRNYTAAGRTDRGVSALAQTVAFDCPDWLSPSALNSHLPSSIRAWARADPPAGFHATHHARRRTYEYHLYAPAADPDRARAALDRLAGGHDFHNLTPDETGTVRSLTTDCRADGDFLVVTVSAGGFARELVRRVVSLVGAVAAGESEVTRVDRVLGETPISGPEGVAAAPPEPLVLTDVTYDVDFAVDEDALADAHELFERRFAAAATGARVAATIRDGLPR
ncbi:MAG: tRNA pseudouridine(38-40) synthase TruA [Halobacteriaceae archaeon]